VAEPVVFDDAVGLGWLAVQWLQRWVDIAIGWMAPRRGVPAGHEDVLELCGCW